MDCWLISSSPVTLHLAQDYCRKVLPSLNDNRKEEIIVILAVMTAASTVAVAMRIFARRMSAAKYGLDDLFILIALVGLTVLHALSLPK